MNKLKAHITHITTEGELSLINLSIGDVKLTSIVVDTPLSAPYLFEKNSIYVLFKETEVTLSKEINLSISTQNQLQGKVATVEKGKLLSSVNITGEWGSLTSVITTNSLNELGILNGDSLIALIKTTEMMLAPC